MAVQLSKYEDAALAFLKVFPIGSTVTSDRVIGWASTYKNGLAADLLIDDPSKRLSSLRRHLNNGGASRNLAEKDRIYVEMVDKQRGTMIVRSLQEYVREQSDLAFDKSVRGAVAPLNRQQKALDDVKKEELPDEDREDIETQMHELVEASAPLKQLLTQQITGRWTNKLIARGYTEEAARHVIDLAPVLLRMQKLLKATS